MTKGAFRGISVKSKSVKSPSSSKSLKVDTSSFLTDVVSSSSPSSAPTRWLRRTWNWTTHNPEDASYSIMPDGFTPPADFLECYVPLASFADELLADIRKKKNMNIPGRQRYSTPAEAIRSAARDIGGDCDRVVEEFTNASAPFIPYLETAHGDLQYRFDMKENRGFLYGFTSDNRLCLKVSDREDGYMDVAFGQNRMTTEFFDGQLKLKLRKGETYYWRTIDGELLLSLKIGTHYLDPEEYL